MHIKKLGLAAVLAFAPGALAQDMGLDLSDPGQGSETSESQTENAPLDLSGSDSSTESAPSSSSSSSGSSTASKPASDEPGLGEREITQEDRVKSVQRKVYLKKGRVELAPFVGFSVNDPYYSKVSASVRGAWYLADTLAVSARVSGYQMNRTEDARTAKAVFQSRIFPSEPVWSAMGDVEWSPLYGKVAFYNSILHFDAYLLAGAGAVSTVTSGRAGGSPNVAADLGVGARFVAKDFLAVNVALINTTYVDTPVGTIKSATQNLMMVNAGISLFFPMKSTGKDGE